MDVKELRQGNYVLFGVEEERITGTWRNMVKFPFFSTWTDSKRIEAIPLTEEWLVRMGFQRRDNCWAFQPEFENILYRITECNGWVLSKGFGDWNNELTMVRWVHQLQNIIFFLTDVELTINI